MIIAETWIELLKDYNHWLFELISGGIEAGVIALILRPVFRNALRLHDERKHKHIHCDDVHPEDGMKESVETKESGKTRFPPGSFNDRRFKRLGWK